jgi:hypothetical protein
MRKIIYYTWIGISVAFALPIAFLIIFYSWSKDKLKKTTCKKCTYEKKD